MNLQAEKIKLIEWLIGIKDVSILEKLDEVRKSNSSTNDNDSVLSSNQIEILKKRRSNHLNGTSKSYSWEETQKLVKT